MSFFMISMRAVGLDIETAGVEAHALADQRDLGVRTDRPRSKSISRGARAAARPTAWMSGKFSASRSSPTIATEVGAVARGKRARSVR